MLITGICFIVIFLTHAFLGEWMEGTSWGLWKVLGLTLASVLLSVIIGVLTQTFFPIIITSLVFATLLQRKFMKQPVKG